MKSIIILILLSSTVFGSTLYKDNLTCIKTSFFNSQTKVVLSKTFDNDGMDRLVNGKRVICKQKKSKITCDTGSRKLVIDKDILKILALYADFIKTKR